MSSPIETGPPEDEELLQLVDAALGAVLRVYLRQGYTLQQAGTNLSMRVRPAMQLVREENARLRAARRER